MIILIASAQTGQLWALFYHDVEAVHAGLTEIPVKSSSNYMLNVDTCIIIE